MSGTTGETQATPAPAEGQPTQTASVEPQAPATLLTEPASNNPPPGDQPSPTAPETEPAAESATPSPADFSDLKFPEGIDQQHDLVTKFPELAKELNFTKEQAQAVVDKFGPMVAAALTAPRQAWAEQTAQWDKQCRNDPQYGGPKLQDTLTQAGRFFDDMVGPPGSEARNEFNRFLYVTGAGNHPALFRMIAKAASVYDSSPISGGGPVPLNRRNPAEVIYPNQGRPNGAG